MPSWMSPVGCTTFGLRSAGGDEKPHETLIPINSIEDNQEWKNSSCQHLSAQGCFLSTGMVVSNASDFARRRATVVSPEPEDQGAGRANLGKLRRLGLPRKGTPRPRKPVNLPFPSTQAPRRTRDETAADRTPTASPCHSVGRPDHPRCPRQDHPTRPRGKGPTTRPQPGAGAGPLRV